MSEAQPKFQRKNYFIRKGLQLKFSAIIFIATFVIGIISIWTTYITTWNQISTQIQSKNFYQQLQTVYEEKTDSSQKAAMINSLIIVEFSKIFDNVSSALILRLLIGALLLFILSIFVSHKIAGPIFRMENAAQSVRDGDLSVDLSKLRAGDELKDLARAINGAISKLRMLMERYRDMAGKLNDLAAKISVYKEGGQSASEESAQLIKELEVVSSQLVTEMNYFKTKRDELKEKIKDEKDKGDISHF